MVIVNEISNTAWTNPLSQEKVFYFTLYQSALMEDLFTVGFMHYVTCHYILKVWDSHKTQLYCSQIGLRFLLIYWFDNMFRPLHLGHYQVYKMFIRVQVNYYLL